MMRHTAITAALASFVSASAFAAPEVTFYTPSIVRIVRAPNGEKAKPVPVVVIAKSGNVKVAVSDTDAEKTWTSAGLVVSLDKAADLLTFKKPDGTVLLAEAAPAKFAEKTYSDNYKVTAVSQKWAYPKDRPLYGLGSI